MAANHITASLSLSPPLQPASSLSSSRRLLHSSMVQGTCNKHTVYTPRGKWWLLPVGLRNAFLFYPTTQGWRPPSVFKAKRLRRRIHLWLVWLGKEGWEKELGNSVKKTAFIHHEKEARGSSEDLLLGILDDLQANRPSVITLLNNAKPVGHSFFRESRGYQVLSREWRKRSYLPNIT